MVLNPEWEDNNDIAAPSLPKKVRNAYSFIRERRRHSRVATAIQRRRNVVTSGFRTEKSETRGGAKMREYLMDASRDPKQIRLPFSANQVGIYHEVLLAGTEHIRRRRDLLRAVEEHDKGAFGGPIKNGQDWLNLERYKAFRQRSDSHDSLTELKASPTCIDSPSVMLRLSPKQLIRCPTPPLAHDLFIGFLESDDAKPWPGFMEHLDTRDLGRESSSSSDESLSKSDTEYSNDPSIESLINCLPSRPLNTAHSILDGAGAGIIDDNQRKETTFQWYHGAVQPERYTTDMTNFALKLQEELEKARQLYDLRPRIRVRNNGGRKEHISIKEPALNKKEILSPSEFIGSATLPEFPFILSNTLKEPLTTTAEEKYLFNHCWSPRGLSFAAILHMNMSLQEAWDIGRKGCFAKITVYNSSNRFSHSCLRFLVMDGTEDASFLAYYSWDDQQFRQYEFPQKIGNISGLDVRDGLWDIDNKEIRVYSKNDGRIQEIVIQHMTRLFFVAVLVCTRHNESLRQLYRIRRRRYFQRRFDIEEAYLKALRSLLLHTKALGQCLSND